MGLLTTLALGLLTVVGFIIVAVYRVLAPVVPVKGKTNIPGTTEGRRWPIVGDALWLYGMKNTKDMWLTIEKLCDMRKVMSFYFGPKLMICIADAKTAQTLMSTNKCLDKDIDFYHAFKAGSDGIFSRNGKEWSDFRRPLDKMLHTKNMENLLMVTADKTKILLQKIESKCGEGVFHVDDLIKYCTLDITLENLFHVRGDQQVEDTMRIPATVSIVLDAILNRVLKPQYRIDWIYKISQEGRNLKKAKKTVEVTFQKMINDCRDRLAREGRDPTDPDFVPENYIEAAIRVALLHNDSEETLTFSFLDMIIAGFDTSSVAMSSMILFLAMHPEYQEKVYQEQLEVMKYSLDVPSRDELAKMSYLEMVFNDTLRHVTVPVIGRTLTEAIKIDGNIYPEGASLTFAIGTMFYDPTQWERPKEFYPDHFLPEKVAKRTKGAFMAFSSGSRGCPGKIFAYLSSKLIMSMIVRRFKFTTDLKFEDMTYKLSLMRESEKGYPVVATRRITQK